MIAFQAKNVAVRVRPLESSGWGAYTEKEEICALRRKKDRGNGPVKEFLRWGQVQEKLNRVLQETGAVGSFYDAVYTLWKEGAAETAQSLPVVPFRSWDVSDLEEFDQLYDQTPVEIRIFYEDFLRDIPCVKAAESVIALDVIPLKLAANQSQGLHRHDSFEMLYVMGGGARLEHSGGSRRLPQGTFCILSPGLAHDALAEPGSQVISILFSEYTIENTLYKLLQEESVLSAFFRAGLGGEKVGFQLFSVVEEQDVRVILRSIFHEYYSQREYARQVCSNYIEILFACVLRQCGSNYEQHSENARRLGAPPMLSILKYIQANYRTTSLGEVAKLFHYEAAYLSKLIKANLGRGYVDIIRELRLTEAKRLLRTTKLSMDQVAEQAGYHNQVHFYREFRAQEGITPGGYRQAQGEASERETESV